MYNNGIEKTTVFGGHRGIELVSKRTERRVGMISKQMKELIEQYKTVDPNDGESSENYWAKTIEVMTANLKWTIDYIDSASEEDTLYSSEVWDDISEFWRSQELIDAMERAKERFPGIAPELETSISFARMAIKNDEQSQNIK